jgi:DNA-binding NtrC family response regulator
LVVKLSESFADLWDTLAADVGAEFSVSTVLSPTGTDSDLAALVLAAGGSERAALEWLDREERPRGVPLFVAGADEGRRTATQVVSSGASDYFAIPEDLEILTNALRSSVARRLEAIRRTALTSDGESSCFSEIIGESAAIRELLARAARVIDHPGTTVLIVGETGTGKELLAKAVHNGGARRSSPFVAVNCSAIPDHLVESELFGHERGAFTDAHSTKPGLFEIADGGTLFLDEIGALPSPLQAKLLRVLQDGEVRRVGGTKARKVDVRILAATNENIGEAIRSGAFREDLYYRLGVITLSLPPLRERDEDAVVIAEALLDQLSEQHGVPTPAVRPEVRRVLLEYPWPGNVRELKNAVERALLLSPPGSLDTSELLPQSDVESRDAGLIPFPASLDDITAAAASATLDLCKGNRSAAARRLRISRRRLRRLLGEEQLTA